MMPRRTLRGDGESLALHALPEEAELRGEAVGIVGGIVRQRRAAGAGSMRIELFGLPSCLGAAIGDVAEARLLAVRADLVVGRWGATRKCNQQGDGDAAWDCALVHALSPAERLR